ncbi:hypothetical protein [uncultured Alistipes sp.]|uniref:hypothetical protein n=1 Tax=uncultured Alistipes sp. TaxID=538949 RepID=UPI00261CC4C6|nr:hypothetical protein [uncultured Alistipes sp.]
MLSLLLILSLVNWGIAATYVVARDCRMHYPLWVWAAVVLLCWMPAAIYPVTYLAERRSGRVPPALSRRKIGLALLLLALVAGTQAAVAALLCASGERLLSGEWPELCAAVVSLLLSVALIAAVRRMEHRP